MFDSAQRNIHYLRLSVTDLCNLRCRYCMPDGVEKLEREAVLTYEEFLRLAALFARCGIDTVRVTGGEPLVRKGVDQLVAGLKAIPGIRKVTMTTNGILLAQQLPALLAAAEEERVLLRLPKFEAEWGGELSDALAAMGLETAFDPDRADFSALGTAPDGPLYVSSVVHKARIEVNEKGTEAAAATVAGLNGAAAPTDYRELVLDRPFCYAVVDLERGVPLFLGTFERP